MPEGGSETFTVALATQPSGDVKVTIAQPTNTDVTVDVDTAAGNQNELTFTASNWKDAQMVTVSAAEDADAIADSTTLSLSASGGDYGSVAKSIEVSVTENDSPALTITQEADPLPVSEGGSETFTVALATQPSGDVTVTIARPTNTDVTVSPASLIFTASNWNETRDVTVSAAEDADAIADSTTVRLSASGGDYGSVAKDIEVSVSENDSPGLTITQETDPLSVSEGGSETFTVALATQPSGDVTVTIARPTNTDVTVSPASLTFTASNWKDAQTVTVSAAEDADAITDSTTLSLSASGGDYGSVAKSIEVSVTENDSQGLTIAQETDPLVVSEGGNETFKVALATQPSADVTVAVARPTNTDVTVSPASLTFTASNWKDAQTVTVSAAEDADAIADSTTVRLSASGGDYGSVAKDIEVSVSENDEAGLTITQETDPLRVPEGGSETFTVALATQPSGDVTVTIARPTNTDMTASPASLIFTASNWKDAQTVTVSAAEDADALADSTTVRLSASGGDYISVAKDIEVSVSENDEASLTVAQETDPLRVPEGGSETFTVALATQPSGDVTVTIARPTNTDVTVSPASLIFTASNWNETRDVTVSASEDADALADSTTVRLSASGGDYGSVAKDIEVSVSENDSPGLTIEQETDPLVVSEGGNETFKVALATQPSADVTVTIARPTNTDVTVSPASLIFTASNWKDAQTVTVSAAEDADAITDSTTVRLSASGGDYGSVAKDIEVSVSENDSPGLTIAQETDPLVVSEGGNETFKVALATQPSADVTVTIARPTNTDVTVSPASLIFTASNWKDAQTVTVSAAEDADALADSTTVTLSASGGDYGSISKGIEVSVSENDEAGLTITQETDPLSVPEGGSETFTVALATQPSGDVTVAVARPTNTDVTVNPASLIFTASNWNETQDVTVSAAEDADAIADSTTVRLNASGGDYGSVAKYIEVSVTENDSPGLTITQEMDPLSVPEGGSETFTVALATQPSGDVKVTIARPTNTDVTVTPASLTFTASNWNETRDVTVSAAEDADAITDSTTVRLNASGGDYSSVSKDIEVSVSENDEAGMTITQETDPLRVSEGDSETFTVALATQPSADVTVTIARPTNTDVTVSPASLIFTASNWKDAQTVTVSAAEDADALADSTTVTLSASGGDYGSISKGIEVSVSENDEAGLTITQETDPLSVPEGGSETFTVALATQPSADVKVTIAQPTNTDVTVDVDTAAGNQNELTFTASNWKDAQTVTVSAAEDADALADSTTVRLSASGGDYISVAKDIEVSVSENDEASLTVAQETDPLRVPEGGNETFKVALATQPSGDVTVTIARPTNTDVTVSPASLIFTASNWNETRDVTVSASEDADALADSTTVRLSASGGDYISVAKDIEVSVSENDEASLTVAQETDPLRVPEGGSETFTVALATRPSADVKVTIAQPTNTDVTVTPASLTFTASNWNETRDVTVSAAEDADAIADSTTLSLSASGGDYISVAKSIEVSVSENDSPGLTITQEADPLPVSEGGSETFTVALATQPSADVKVTIAQPTNTDVTVDVDTVAVGNQNELTFTASNWKDAQTVTVSAAEDADALADSTTLSLSASGGDYISVAKSIEVSVSENDSPGLTIAQETDPLRVSEGGSETFKVALVTQPSADVTVTIARPTNTDVTVSPASLIFTASNWNETRDVTVSAAEDADAIADSTTVRLSASGGDYISVAKSIEVSVSENDSPGLTIAQETDPLRVSEGGSETFKVALVTQPTADVTVTIARPTNTDVTVSPASLIFTASNWNETRDVTVSASEDADALADSTTVRLSASGGDYGSVSKDIEVSVTENDSPGLTITQEADPLPVSEGGSETFTVALATQPSADVKVTIAQPTNTDVTVDVDTAAGNQNELIFTASNWKDAQMVTVSAAEDADAIADSTTLSLSASGGDYISVAKSIEVSVTENDSQGLTIAQETDPLRVPEGGSETFTVALATQPSGDVTVAVARPTNTDVTVSPASLIFTASNWNETRDVTVSAAEDADALADSTTVTLSASGGDYGSISKGIEVSVSENDEAGLTITQETDPLSVSEGGSETFTVALATQPSADVTVTIARPTNTDVTVTPASLTFTASNWNEIQDVTVSAAEDADALADSTTLSLSASGGDYISVAKSIEVSVTENDSPGLTITQETDPLSVSEGGSETFTVALATRPSGDVTVAVARPTNTDMTVSPASLIFTASNWKDAQTVTVSAAEDADAIADSTTVRLNASGGDYGSVAKYIEVSVTENDSPGLTITQEMDPLSVPEGGSETFTVALATQPSADVKVTIAQPTNTDVTVDVDTAAGNQNELTFTASNWKDAQTVTVSAAEDADAIADSTTLSLSTSGGDYGSVLKDIEVSVTENDSPGLTITQETDPLRVPEGGSETFTVALATQPSGDVTVTIARPTNTDVTVNPASLTFTASNWNEIQDVTVSAAEDADAITDSTTVRLNASGGDYSSVSKDIVVSVSENDEAGLTITQETDPLRVSEGDSETFTVTLATQPSGDVTVAVARPTNTDVTVSPASLIFTASNWKDAQTVTVSAAEDADAIADSTTVRLNASGGDYSSVSKDIEVSVSENDSPGLTITQETDPLSVSEGGSETFTVALATQPSADVTVAVARPTNTDVTASPASLIFTASNWKDAQTVTVSAAEDADAITDSTTVRLNASGGDYSSVSKDIEVSVSENDEAGLTITQETDPLSVSEGGSETFTVALATQPSADVTVAVARPTNTDVTVSPASLIFTASNWNETRDVTVSAAEDADAIADSTTVRLSASGGDYGSVAKDIEVSVSENDSPGLTITQETDPLSVSEGGSETFTVALATQPSGDVTVTVARPTNTDMTVSPASLIFTASNWKDAQTVTVSASEDADALADSTTVTLSASGGDYGSISKGIEVSVSENDEAGLTITQETDPLSVPEGGSETFTVALATQPSADVKVTIAQPTNTDVTVDVDTAAGNQNELTFTASNWKDAQTVTVSAAEDADAIADSTTLSLSASGGDYISVAKDIEVSVSENDEAGLTITQETDPLRVSEGGSETFTVALATQPSGDVTVTIARPTNTDVTVSPASLIFTASNWKDAQTVTVSVAEDADAIADSTTLSLSASGGDYISVAKSIEVSVTENDSPGLTITQETDPLSVSEGGSETFTVALATRPSGDVTVAVARPTNTDVTVSPASLIFTASNWKDAQTVTVSASEDADAIADSTTLSLSASGGDYISVAKSIEVSVTENDSPGLTIAQETDPLRVPEGGSETFTVALATQPSGDVTVTVARPTNTDMTVSPASLIFTASNWKDAQTVTVSAAEDADAIADSTTVRLSASGGDYGSVAKDIEVSVSENDSPGLTIAQETDPLRVSEGGSETFTVALATQPSGDVTVAVARPTNTDVTVSPASLIFTASNWKDAQTVTVRAAEDDDAEDDSARVILTLSGGGYDDIARAVAVSITDNERDRTGGLLSPGLVLSTDEVVVAEGASNSFTVRLGTQPSENVRVSLAQPSNTDVRVNETSLIFTADNWNVEQSVTVRANEDHDGIADSAIVSLTATGADYGGVVGSVRVQVVDNDAPGLILSSLLLEVDEGGSESVDVKLSAQPSGEVSLALTKSGSADVSFSPSSMIFTPSNWDESQTITVNAAEDSDGHPDTASLSLTATGADYGGVVGSVQVQVVDNDAPGLILSTLLLAVDEGGSGSVGVKLSAQPSGEVSLALAKSGSADVSFSPSSMIFTPSNWDESQAITVNAAEDSDGHPDTASLSLTASGADYGGVVGSVQVQVVDNDAPGLILSTLRLTVDEGGSESVDVKLSAQPSGEVSLALTKSGSADVSFTPSSMIFTPSNWDESQAITVNAAEDSDGHPDTASLSLTASGADYEGITAGVQVQVVENDTLGLSVTPRKLEVKEGKEAPFTVSLTAQPNYKVSVALTSGNPDVTLSPSQIHFTPSDWNRPKTVVARAAEDDDLLADSTTVTLRASGTDFDDITGSVHITVIDDDAEEEDASEGPVPQVVFDLTLTPESLSLDEGSSASFTVRARSQPVDEEMVFALIGGGSPDVSFDTDPDTAGLQNTVTITPENWDVEQPVSVHAAEDDDAAPDRASASFVDAVGNVIIFGRVSVADNDTPGLSVAPAALRVAENTSGSFTVRPQTKPLGDILVSLDNGETDTVLSPPNLKFTSSNWRTARSVEVAGVADADAEDDAPADITLTVQGADYDGVFAQVQVGVDEAAPGTPPEEATPGLVIVGAPVEINEGGRRDLRVMLRNRPTGDVELALSVSGGGLEVDADMWREGNQSTLRFSPSNYKGTRVVSLFAPEDEDASDDRASVSLTASGANYDGLTAEVSVNIDDNDSPALLVSNPAVIDDRRASFTVRLSVEPSAAVDVALSVAGEVEGVTIDTDPDTPGNQTALAFAASDFDIPQRVVVADEDFEGSSVDIVLAAAGGDYEGIVDRVTVPLGVGEYTDEGDPRYWWPVRALALAIAPLSAGDRTVVSVGCRQEDACEVYLDCSAQMNGTSFRGGLPEAIVGWGVATLSAQDIVDITGGDWSGMGRLGCALHSEERISAQVWTRSGDGVLVNNSALIKSVNIEGVHRADIESIPGPGELDLSNIRIRCRAAYTKHCGMTAFSCYDDEGSGYHGELGTIKRRSVRHIQTSELADIIGHRWSGATLGCEFRSDEPFTVQVLTRTGGGGALINNNATGQSPF